MSSVSCFVCFLGMTAACVVGSVSLFSWFVLFSSCFCCVAARCGEGMIPNNNAPKHSVNSGTRLRKLYHTTLASGVIKSMLGSGNIADKPSGVIVHTQAKRTAPGKPMTTATKARDSDKSVNRGHSCRYGNIQVCLVTRGSKAIPSANVPCMMNNRSSFGAVVRVRISKRPIWASKKIATAGANKAGNAASCILPVSDSTGGVHKARTNNVPE